MSSKRLIIAVDGPAGAGKSTIAKRVAQILNIEYIDTGAMYRALTLKVIRSNIGIDNIEEIIKLMESTTIEFINNHIYLDGKNVDKEIRENIISKNVSYIAKIKEVRLMMIKLQRQIAESTNLIMDGRDIGTIVLPHANYKFFVTASVEERARRRYIELTEEGKENITYEQVLEEIKIRDKIDSTREIAPLKKSPDAYVIDTTNKTIEESVNEIIAIIERG
ncbi:MAG: (d)CMP kinase [Tissierellia bacterium]|nr:(d)CMP kinase [Tissierellia bacterium]